MSLGWAPLAAIHHPEEIRLDPTHPRIFEIATEEPILDRKPLDALAIGLIDND